MSAELSLPTRKHIHRRFLSGVFCVLLGALALPKLLVTCLLCAANHGSAAPVRLLLRIGVSPNAYSWYVPIDETPIMLAARAGSLPTVRVLLQHGADVNTDVNDWSVSPLMCGVEGENPAVVQLLIDKGASLDAMDGSGETPLTLARQRHRPDIVQMLKRAGEKELP